ncbi:hypothetical protein Tco_0402996, partial [Tanacetum coccineum]
MVIFGQVSALAVKSLYLTRPSLFQYTAKREELLETVKDVFANIANGVLRVWVNHKYPLSQAAQAHLDLESRKTTGSIMLIPDGVESWLHDVFFPRLDITSNKWKFIWLS